MTKVIWSERLWGSHSRLSYLLMASVILLFTYLGGRELWTQEHRWADIVFGMMFHHDYLHPSLDGNDYYDKPLLSYWMIVAVATLIGKLNIWALRLPSVLSGLISIYAIYQLGKSIKNPRLGLIAAWLLLTTFYFLFWARTSSADMLNMTGTLLAVTWYALKRNHLGFINYSIFFLIMAVTALCKGLVGPVAAILIIFPDLLVEKKWKKHLRFSLIFATIPAAIIYVLPFWASAHYGVTGYHENGLYLVYRENILRYFQPFDHKDPIYTYFLYLPIYLIPWSLFFIPALFNLKKRWSSMSWNAKWMVWSIFILFSFLTISGSRRSYYVLPMVPFAILVTAEWIESGAETIAQRYQWAGRLAVLFLLVFFINFNVAQPWFYSQNGLHQFAREVQSSANKIKPWNQWHFVMLDPESKVRFYLALPPEVQNYSVKGARSAQTHETLLKSWPILHEKPKDMIFITRASYLPLLKEDFQHYQMISMNNYSVMGLTKSKKDYPVAFIPRA